MPKLLWLTKPGARNSAAAAALPRFQTSSKKRRTAGASASADMVEPPSALLLPGQATRPRKPHQLVGTLLEDGGLIVELPGRGQVVVPPGPGGHVAIQRGALAEQPGGG